MKYTFFLSLWLLGACGGVTKQEKVASASQVKSTAVDINYLKVGDEITNTSQAALLKEISWALSKKGNEGAVGHCNLKAVALVDSLSDANQCEIRRVSDKYRNPNDKAQNTVETKALQIFLEKHSKQEALKPFTLQEGENTYYFKPIMLGMETCLSCHGIPQQDIQPATLTTIRRLYPNDLAVGYKLKDFRGMWVVKW